MASHDHRLAWKRPAPAQGRITMRPKAGTGQRAIRESPLQEGKGKNRIAICGMLRENKRHTPGASDRPGVSQFFVYSSRASKMRTERRQERTKSARRTTAAMTQAAGPTSSSTE